MTMFERIRKLFSRSAKNPPPESAEVIGADLDYALATYTDLLDAGCKFPVAIEAAEERIADLRERYQQAKLEHLEDWSR